MKQKELTIGCDPEIFLADSDGNFLNAYNFLGQYLTGTKENPDETPYGGIQIDGMAVEFNTKPTSDVEEFDNLIAEALQDIDQRFGGNVHPTQTVVKTFLLHELVQQPLRSRILGCDPDLYLNENLRPPDPDAGSPVRCVGGHVHIGWGSDLDVEDYEYQETARRLVKELDDTVGNWCIERDFSFYERANHYGNLGCYRHKTYGIEYRTPTNFWIWTSKDRVEMFKRCVKAAEKVLAA